MCHISHLFPTHSISLFALLLLIISNLLGYTSSILSLLFFSDFSTQPLHYSSNPSSFFFLFSIFFSHLLFYKVDILSPIQSIFLTHKKSDYSLLFSIFFLLLVDLFFIPCSFTLDWWVCVFDRFTLGWCILVVWF